MSKQFQPLSDGEVVAVQGTYRVNELTNQIRSKIASSLAEWGDEQGVNGEVLRFGSGGWEKGQVRLRLSIEFCPDEDDGRGAAVSSQGTATASTGGGAPGAAAVSAAVATSAPMMAMVADPVAPAAPFSPAVGAVALAEPPKIESTLEDEQFDLGTHTEVTGEIDLNLTDGDADGSGYVDFDLSDSLPEIGLDEIVAQGEMANSSIIDEVWQEMSQPNWPGVARA